MKLNKKMSKSGMDVAGLKQQLENFQKSAKDFDWRSLKKYTSPQAFDDLNTFLEKLPQNTGNTMLMIAAVTWGVAVSIGLFTTVQLQKVTELRMELQEAQAASPTVPTIKNNPVNTKDVAAFVNEIEEIYQGLEIRSSGPSVVITARTTNMFGQFREAVGHVQNGGSGWRVSVDSLCVGRECERSPLGAVLRINTVSVSKPG